MAKYVFIFTILFNVANATPISNKFITKKVAKSLKNEIVSVQKEESIENDSRWRYEMQDRNSNENPNWINNPLNIQIPLIWYHERF